MNRTFVYQMEKKNTYHCKRCHQVASADMICQSCKNELLANFEATSDWQTAYEIERAQLIALKYQAEDSEENDNLYY